MKKAFFLLTLISLSLHSFSQEKLPTTALKTLDGKTLTLNELAKTQDLMVVSLWATWCVPCKNELDAINDVYEDWQEEIDVKLYAVSIDDSRTVKRVKPLVNGKSWEFDVLLDTNNDLKRALGTATVPLTLIIKNGEIVYRHSGYVPGGEDDILEELKKHI